MQKFQATHERYNVLKDTNKDFVLQEIHEIVQEINSEEVQPQPATNRQPMIEEIQPKVDIVQQHNDKLMQQKIEEEKQQNNLLQPNVQEKRKQEGLFQQKQEEDKENQKLTLKPLPDSEVCISGQGRDLTDHHQLNT
ncbi:hypothetical protein PIB30_100514 [Stylosanthes scabra]|uniref:Uncharacterized protein n=1 Tax=Stylosanthes scabra TaxID=79078 RepID=A0ABU6WYU7_9FABA|nr:hypothetical protein [Stylosanthes scabra]